MAVKVCAITKASVCVQCKHMRRRWTTGVKKMYLLHSWLKGKMGEEGWREDGWLRG